MPRHLRFLVRLAAVSAALAALAAGAFAATERVESASPLKRYQARLLLSEPMREKQERRERMRELRELAREMKRHGQAAMVRRGSRIKSDVPDEDVRAGRALPPAALRATPVPARAEAPPLNVRANNTAGDFAGEGQCETSIASYGRYMLAAWNDSKGWRDGTGQTQGWATSTDGGLTWTDQGTLPIPSSPASWKWSSDPVVVVNPSTGAFYYCGLGDATGNLSGIGVIKGRFSGNTFTWTNLSAARSEDVSSNYLDKEWMAVDPVSGGVYLTYTNFTGGLDRIEFQHADSSLTSWSSPLKLSAAAEDGYVQGSRPIVGPGGVVYVTWYSIGLVDADYLRICRSTNGGASFTAAANAVSYFTNWGTGAPGFNRSSPIPNFPSIAVDGGTGPHAGRLYLSWSECLNWYDDEPAAGLTGAVSEVEGNDAPASGTPVTPGNLVRGSLSSSSDLDYFKVALLAGQTLLVEADSSAGGVSLSLRLFATDQATRLTWTVCVGSDIAAGFKPGWIYTAPTAGTYYLRVAAQSGVGGYRLRTGFAARSTERGGDQRDVFVAHSDNSGVTWSTPVRVDDAPVGYDGWLPEVAVSPDGRVFCAWYDWRDAAPASNGGESSIYLARSADGGDTWTQLGAVSDTLSNWTACDSYLAPNQGDYMSLYAGPTTLTACWSDARGGTPDTYVASLTIGTGAATVAVVSAEAVPGRVDLRWTATPADGFRATVERLDPGASSWATLDTVTAALDGSVVYTDTAVELGATYTYRLGVLHDGAVTDAGQVSVLVPSGLALAMRGVQPNPTDGVNASLSFTLPYAEPADLEVFDLTGRLVQSQSISGLGAASHTIPFALWPSARSGVYLVRITQRGQSSTARVTLVR
jgi:hypothetical protein